MEQNKPAASTARKNAAMAFLGAAIAFGTTMGYFNFGDEVTATDLERYKDTVSIQRQALKGLPDMYQKDHELEMARDSLKDTQRLLWSCQNGGTGLKD